MFKVGDKVKCVSPISFVGHEFDLDKDRTYIIRQVNTDTINLEHQKNPMVNNTYFSYTKTRFILDVKEQRKQKLNKICLK